MNEFKQLNGLEDCKSVLELKNELPVNIEDVLGNKDTFVERLKDLYYDEAFTMSEFNAQDFGEPITLLSTLEDTLYAQTSVTVL